MREQRPVVENEAARLDVLRRLRLLDTPPSESFDRIARLASRLLGAPVSAISLTDSDRQWFKSRVGLDVAEVPREDAPCNYAIRADEVLVVPDLLADPRFADAPLARTGARFYAGAPLITRSGYGLGTLCVVDTKPRALPDEDVRVLADLANMVMTQIEVQNSIGRIHPASGQPNEYQLLEDLEDLARCAPGRRQLALMVEVVPARHVMQGMRALGASFVEQLEHSTAEAIRAGLGSAARLYHIGSTRCAALLDEDALDGCEQQLGQLEARLRVPLDCGGVPVRPAPAIGVHAFVAGQAAPRDVLRRLYNALGDARDAGRPRAHYDQRHDDAHTRRFQLLGSLDDALAAPGQLSLVYQPRVEVASGECVSVEALLRWRHPRFGDVPPAEFIPLVEETDYIRPLTQWVIDGALAQLARWRDAGLRHRVSINISALNLEEPCFAGRLAAALAASGVPAGAIELEFTESALARDGERASAQLATLRAMGVDIAIDDFGTGYSSLAYLQQLPASVLKIDRTFTRALATSERDRKLVRSTVAMARDLGYRVVAEGIENVAAFGLLSNWGCNEAQGYFFSPPLPPAELEQWLAERQVPAAVNA